ncbi:hypothetical protein [Variovorax sp. HW608]|uniref:hypothetical protein n=1 Tax=Variovorax sp. HW608 TaxID=1034889 RepID=UPI000B5AEA05|nr:hypothetical protein [Variovorax sp. HW608]
MKLQQGGDEKGLVMKGLVVEKRHTGVARASKAGSNAKAWAVDAVSKHGCQEAVDAKAFTGRGTLRELRHLLATLDSVESRMAALSEASKQAGFGIYLMVHRRAATGYTHLRWREHGGAKRHLKWEDAAEHVGVLTPEVRNWVRDASGSAIRLNGEHLRSREQIKQIRAHVRTKESHIYPRSAFGPSA